MASTYPSPPPRNDIVRGIALRCGSVLGYAAMSAFMKTAATYGDVTAIEMMFYRSVFGLPVVLLWLALGPGIGMIRTRRPLAHLSRSTLGIAGILLNLQALILLPLATATTIGFSAPIFATILSALILSEKIGRHRWAAVVIGFAGIALVMRPGGGAALPAAGVACAIFGALGTASVAITLRRIGGTEHPGGIVFWFFTCSAVVGGIGTFFVGSWHGWPVMALLLGGGVAGAFMQLLVTMSLQVAPVSAIAPFDYTQIIWATLLDWLIWSDAPTLTTIGGASLIVASGIYTGVREHRIRKAEIQATPLLE